MASMPRVPFVARCLCPLNVLFLAMVILGPARASGQVVIFDNVPSPTPIWDHTSVDNTAPLGALYVYGCYGRGFAFEPVADTVLDQISLAAASEYGFPGVISVY